MRQTCTVPGRYLILMTAEHRPTRIRFILLFLFVSWTPRCDATITKQSLITTNKTNYINYNMHISDYMFHRLNGHLQAVYIHKQKNYIFKYHFKGLDFLKVF